MITIKTLKGKSSHISNYLCREQSGIEGYYSQEGKSESLGSYVGGTSWGLDGKAVGTEFSHLLDGKNPIDGTPLYKSATAQVKRRVGFDLTLSPDKSVSLLWARLEGPERERLEAAFNRAVRDTLKHAEDYSLSEAVRRGKGGLKREAPAEVTWAVFRHGVSREKDPQLHAHCVLINAARRLDGTYGALQEQELFRSQKELRAVFDAALSHHLKNDLGLEVFRHKEGMRIKGVSGDLIRYFSKRREAIEKAAEALSTSTKVMGSSLNLATRPEKPKENARDLFAGWQKEMSDLGFSARDAQMAIGGGNLPRKELSLQDKEQLLDEAMRAASAEKNILSRSQVRAYVMESFTGVLPASEMGPLFEKAFSSGRFIALKNDKDKGAELFTPRLSLEIEKSLVALGQKAAAKGQGSIDKKLIDKVLQSYRASGSKPMSYEQAEAARHLLSSGNISLMVGAAGTGKSYSLEAVREVYQKSGYRVLGAAPTGRAAEGLQMSAGIKSSTIDRLLLDISKGRVELNRKSVIIVDEAGMVGSQKMSRLQQAADEAGARLHLVGDDRQLSPVEQGRPFYQLKAELGAVEISEVRRQREEWQREAAAEFRSGDAITALQRYQSAGMVHHFQGWESCKRQVMGDWFRDRMGEPEKSQLILAARNDEVRDLNLMARGALLSHGELGAREQYLCPVTIKDNDTNKIHLAAGERIYFLKNDSALGVFNGNLATIERIARTADGSDFTLTAKLDSGQRVDFSLSQYSHINYGYAATVHKSQGATVDRTYVVPSQMTSRELSYVMASRHRDECHFYIATEKVSNLTQQHTPELATEGRIKLNLERAAAIMGRSEEQAMAHAMREQISKVESRFELEQKRTSVVKDLVAPDHRAEAALLLSKEPLERIEATYKLSTMPRATELRYDPVVTEIADYQKEAGRLLKTGDFSDDAMKQLKALVDGKAQGVMPALTDKERAAHYDRFIPCVHQRSAAIDAHKARELEKTTLFISSEQRQLLSAMTKESDSRALVKSLGQLARTDVAVGPSHGETSTRGWLQQESALVLDKFSEKKAKEFAQSTLNRSDVKLGAAVKTTFGETWLDKVAKCEKGAEKTAEKSRGSEKSAKMSKGRGYEISF